MLRINVSFEIHICARIAGGGEFFRAGCFSVEAQLLNAPATAIRLGRGFPDCRRPVSF